MGDKDHLATPEEIAKNQRRDLKKVVSSIYHGNPPVLTGSIDQIGNVARTTGEVRDTSFPVLPDIDDLTDNIQTAIAGAQATITLQLDKANAQFQRLKLDDLGGSITSFVIDLTNLAKNKALEFIADIETVFAGTPTVAFAADGNPITMDGLPPSWPFGKNKFKFNVAAIDTPLVTSYEVLSSADDFGGGVSFPIIVPVSVRGNVSTTQNIDLAADVAHSTTMTLTGNIAITFSNIPITASQIEWEVEITQDATGGRTITSWPAAVTPTPVIDTAALATTLVVLRVNDGGTIIRTLTSTAGTDASQWANFAAVTDINYATFDGVNIDRLLFDQSAGSALVGTSTGITSDANSNLNSNIPALKQHSFFANAVEIARFIENTASVYRLDMLDHSVVNAQDIRLDDTSGATVFAGTDPAIGYDSVASRFILNMPTGGNLFITNNNAIGSTQINNNSMATNVMNANDVLQLGVDVTVPTVNGEFRMDGTDIFVFSGGAVRNLSNVGAGSPLTTKGDVFGFSTVNARIPVGANDFVLTADSAEALGVKWAAATGGANLQLSNLIATVRPNLNMLANRTTGGTLGADNATDAFFQIHVDKINFPNQTSITATSHVIGRVTGTNNLVINVPSTEAIDIRINGISQILVDGTDVDFSNQNLIDVLDVGSSTDAVENYWAQIMRFPANVIGVSNTHNIFRALKNSTDTMVLNVPTNNDFIISENDAGSLLLIDTSANIISIGAGGSLLGMNVNDKSMSFPTGAPWTFTSSPGFAFLSGDVGFDDNDITDVNNLFITTAVGAAVASIRGEDFATDILEIRLGAAVDFAITDNGTARLAFNNTLLRWEFGGSNLVQLPQETQISDRASAPSTPPSGFMNLYVINVAGVQTFKVKFDNGTEKTIATDV